MCEQLNYQQPQANFTPQFGNSNFLASQSQTQPTLLSQQSMVQQEFQQDKKLQTLKFMPSLTATFQNLRKHNETNDQEIKQMTYMPQRVDLSVNRRLLSISKALVTKEQICPNKSPHDIDLSKVRKYFKRKEVKQKVQHTIGEFKRKKLQLGSQNLAKDEQTLKASSFYTNQALQVKSPQQLSDGICSHHQILSSRVLAQINDSKHAYLQQNAPTKQLNLSNFKDNLNYLHSPCQMLNFNNYSDHLNSINSAKENNNHIEAYSTSQNNSKLLFTPVRTQFDKSPQSPVPFQHQQHKQHQPLKKTKTIEKQQTDKIPRQVQLQYFWAKRQYDYLKQRSFKVFEDRTQVLPVTGSNTTCNSQSLMSTQSTFCSTYDHTNNNKQEYEKDSMMHFETTFGNEDESSGSSPLYCSQVISEQKEILLRRFEDQSQKNKMNKLLEQHQLRMMHQIDFQMQQQQQSSISSFIGGINGFNPNITNTLIVNSETQVSVRNTQDSQVDFTQRVVIGTPSEEGSQDQLNRSNLQYSNHLSNSFSCLDDINSQSYSNSSSQTVIRPFNLINSPESSFSNDEYYR